MSRPTGEQLEIAQSGARAIVTTVGASLRAYEVEGVPYTETFGEDVEPPMAAGAVLVPWPNRVAGARWMLDGKPQDLEITEPERGNAIHGLVRHETWTVTEHTKSRVTLEVTVDAKPGWPFPFRTGITYELGLRGLNVTHTVHNLSDAVMPFGVGAHPYVRPGTRSMADCEITVPAPNLLAVDPVRKIPTGEQTDVRATDFDLRRGRLICDMPDIDHAFGRCKARSGGLIRHSITQGSSGVEVWTDRSFRWVQVYSTYDFPGAVGGFAIAIEPMTCPPDALNSGIDLIHLNPGASWAGRWGIVPL